MTGIGRRRPDLHGRHALVTGAASGIGRATAQLLAARGAVVHLTDLRAEPLQQAAKVIRAAGGAVATVAAADLTVEPDVDRLAATVHAEVPALDAVLNVAGIAIWGRVEDMAPAQWRRVIETNLMGPVHVVERFVPPMVAAGRGGHLVNVSSAAGLVGLPWHAAYSAAKFGLRGMSEVLRFDLARHGIAVTLVCPGGVDTPLTHSVEVAGVDTSTPQWERFRERFERRAVSPAAAAERIVDGMLARRHLVHTSWEIQALFAVQRFAPPLYAAVMHAANRAAERAVRDLR